MSILMHWAQSLPSLYTTINAPELMPDALDGMAEFVGSKGTVLGAFNQAGFTYEAMFGNNLHIGSKAEVAKFFERFQESEKAAWGKVLAAPVGTPVLDFDIWPEGHAIRNRADIIFQREMSGVYRKFGYNLSPDLGWKSAIIFQFDAALDEIPIHAVPQARHFVPHLAKVTELLRFVSVLRQKYNAVYSALNKVNVGLVILDPHGNVVVYNSAADTIFSQGDGLARARGRVHLSDDDAAAELAAHLERTGQTAAGENALSEASLVITRPSGLSPYSLMLSPMKDGNGEIEQSFAGTLMFVFDTANPPKIDVAPLALLAGLTPTETEIIGLLLQGRTDRDIADIRNVAYETVRTQVKRAMDKASVSSRLELVRRAATIMPPVS
ncbi:MAG: helix-turn-helix transcriptional regulator [Mangrovicoccus sp.]|nr:helix-turn-helix transcriptional regulator [Mangrovicoccus sp.]